MGMSKSKSSTKPTKFAEQYITGAGKTLAPTYEDQRAVAKQFQPGMMAAGEFLRDTVGGKYLDEGNPYIDTIAETTGRNTADRVNSQMMGRFGSGYHAVALAREIYENEAKLRGGLYDRERGYQNDAARSYGDVAGQAAMLPGIASGQYTQNAGGLFGQYNKTKSTTPWGPALVNGASNAAAAYFGGRK